MAYIHRLHEAALRKGWDAIEELFGEQENLDVDFKGRSGADDGSLTSKDRDLLGPLIVAFANSMGGVAVIGVDCRRGEDGVDEVQAICAIANARRFASEVRNNIPNFAMPRLEDVTVDFVENPEGKGTGVVMISVGRSERRPHRCECRGRKSYFKRSGTSTLEMEAFEIEDAYRRFSVARLEVGHPTHLPGGTNGTNVYSHSLAIAVRNVSNVTARFPRVQVLRLQGGRIDPYGINGNRHFPLSRELPHTLNAFSGDANIVIHPGQSLEVFRLAFELKIPGYEISHSDQPWPTGFVSYDQAELFMEIATSCENAAQLVQVIMIPGRELLRIFGH